MYVNSERNTELLHRNNLIGFEFKFNITYVEIGINST